MALQHLRSSTANKRPLPAGMSDGQLAINTNLASPGLFLKNSNGDLVKVGPVHVGTTAPNASPAAGGETGNTTGELWLDTSVTPNQLKTWNGSAWVSDFPDEIPVAKLADGAARQLLQTDAAGTGVEWTSNVDVPGTLDVTSTATFDSIARHPLGSAAAPTLTFTDDTNTGVYSPGADQVAVATNGAQRLLIDSSGQIESAGLGTAAAPAWSFVSDPNTGIYSPGADQLALSTGGSGRLFVNASGNVSIGTNGTSAATETLSINGFSGFGDRALTNPFVLLGNTGSGAGLVGTYSNHALEFRTNNSERLRITSAGLVGIGTSAPGTLLELSGDQTAVVQLRNPLPLSTDTLVGALNFFKDDGSGGAGISSSIASRSEDNVGNACYLAFSTKATGVAASEKVRITGAGNVGIGTTIVDERLHVQQGGGSAARVKIEHESTGVAGIVVQNTNRRYDIQLNGSDFQIYDNTASAERARIDSSGRLLVGTSSNSENVIAAFQGFQGSSTGQGIIAIKRGSTPSSGNTVAQIRFNGPGTDEECAYITAAADGTWGTNDYPGRLVFSTTADGASSPTERMRIRQTGDIECRGINNSIDGASSQAPGTSFSIYLGRHSSGAPGSGTQCFVVRTNGNVENTNNSYTGLSDIKLKENIVDAQSQWDDLKALQVRNYNFKPETNHQTHTQIGLVAQEAELVSPGLVSESPDRDEEGNDLGTVTKSVNYSVLYMKAVKALQEAMERIEQLETSNADLLARVAALETP